MIQSVRYGSVMRYEIDIDPALQSCRMLKLMLQPLVENAIYHGMEYMDGDGEIFVRAWQEEKELYLEVRDNGLGMTEEQVESLFTDTAHVASKRGSGIGVRNVNERIKLYFGAEYGLSIESEPDEGTAVKIHLPAVPYEKVLEEKKV